MHVQVVGAAHQLARASGGLRLSGRHSGKKHFLLGHRRRPLDVERGDGLHPPGLALGALGLRPHDRLVIGVEDQEAARADLDAIPAGLVGVEEERLLDGVLVRPRLHHDAVLEEDVRRAQHVLALIDEERDVVQAAVRARHVARVGEVVGLLAGGQPDARLVAVVEHDLLGQPQPEVLLAEDAVLARDRRPGS